MSFHDSEDGGEQGAEAIHAHMMKLDRVYQSIPDEVERLKYIVNPFVPNPA